MVCNKPTQNAVAENTNDLLLILWVELASVGSSILCFIVWGLSFSQPGVRMSWRIQQGFTHTPGWSFSSRWSLHVFALSFFIACWSKRFYMAIYNGFWDTDSERCQLSYIQDTSLLPHYIGQGKLRPALIWEVCRLLTKSGKHTRRGGIEGGFLRSLSITTCLLVPLFLIIKYWPKVSLNYTKSLKSRISSSRSWPYGSLGVIHHMQRSLN